MWRASPVSHAVPCGDWRRDGDGRDPYRKFRGGALPDAVWHRPRGRSGACRSGTAGRLGGSPMRIRAPRSKASRRIALAAAAMIIMAPIGLALDFYLPSHRLVRVLNSDVYLQGRGKKDRTTGVYQIFTEDPDTRRQHVYHNEDTGWGFPFYFKFNSADVQSTAASIATDASQDGNYALVTSYGWRVNLLSMFPNVTAIRRVPRGYVPVPWFNIAFFAALAAVTVWLAYLYRRWCRLRIAPPEAVRRIPQ